MKQPENREKKSTQSVFNMTLAGVAGQVGCFTLLIASLALFLGVSVDNYLDTRPMFTLVFLLASVPIALIVMFFLVKFATDRMKPLSPRNQEKLSKEDTDLGNHS